MSIFQKTVDQLQEVNKETDEVILEKSMQIDILLREKELLQQIHDTNHLHIGKLQNFLLPTQE